MRQLRRQPAAGVVILSSQRGRANGKKRADRQGVARLIKALRSEGLIADQVRVGAHRGASRQMQDAAGAVTSGIDRVCRKCANLGTGTDSTKINAADARSPIGVIAEGHAAEAAVLGSMSDSRVRAFVFLSARLGARAKAVLADWNEVPVLSICCSDDRAALRDTADVYLASEHTGSDVRILEEAGRRSRIIDHSAGTSPVHESLESSIARWLRRELYSSAFPSEVSFATEDGWEIFGNLSVPDNAAGEAAGVILLHSGRSDRHIFSNLERLLARAGFAVLNLDWRGRGKSINKGRYLALSKEERANGKLDARAAIDFLTSQEGVDKNKVALVGVIHGAEHAVRGSIGDPRVKALALLTGYVPASEEESEYLTSGRAHVMYVTSDGHKQVTETMQRLYETTSDKLARRVVYKGGAIGYQLFELDHSLEPAIVEWLKEGVSR